MPALALSIQGQTLFAGLPVRSTLKRWIAAALGRDAQLTLRFVGASEGRRLNRDYRGKDYPTDVLTFSYESKPGVRADIVICVPVVRSGARAAQKPVYDHLAHLIVHAALHAQGHHHDNAVAARRLAAREEQILKSLGKRAPY